MRVRALIGQQYELNFVILPSNATQKYALESPMDLAALSRQLLDRAQSAYLSVAVVARLGRVSGDLNSALKQEFQSADTVAKAGHLTNQIAGLVL